MEKEVTVDLTPTTAGTLRVYATILSGAKANIASGDVVNGLAMIESVIEGLLANANKIAAAEVGR